MRFVADLHIHSRFSRATSRELNLPELYAWAQRKGLYLVGTGDITHPAWLEEIAEQAVPAEEGLFRLRSDLTEKADECVPPACRGDVRFVLQGETSSIYKHEGAVRKVHNLVYCPDLETARKLMTTLDRLGNVRSDGRPILGLSSRDVLEVVLEAGEGTHLVPAHVWTPWFSLLGSKSGYDSPETCFGDLADEIFALETGLSSDPPMNWRLSALDRFALISNSDAHSGKNLAREANEFDLDPSYATVFDSLRVPGDPRFLGTIEFFPEHGKYHLDGHRKCRLRMTPRETLEAGGRCPGCGGKITVGVFHRVAELADRPEGVRPRAARPYVSLVPLAEVLAECFGVGSGTKRVRDAMERILERLGPELFVLRKAPLEEVATIAGALVAEAVRRVREGRLEIAAGYDGEFGTVRIFGCDERAELERQGALFGGSDSGRKDDLRNADPPIPVAHAARRSPGESAREAGRPAPARRPTGERAGGRGPSGALPLFAESRDAERALEGLNSEQIEAVLAPPRPLAIVAGPGTGKTRTLTRRIAHKALSGASQPARILAVTFTNRAAEEMRIRLSELLGPTARGMEILTLHKLGLKILRKESEAAGLLPDFAVLGEDESLALLRKAVSLSGPEAARCLSEVSLAKRSGTGPGADTPLRTIYDAALRGANAVDLDDLIVLSLRLLEADEDVRRRWQEKFTHVAVDEFQDFDRLQDRLLERIAPRAADVTVIGDPDQSIYGFRGADAGIFERFLSERPGARKVALVQNYRSTAAILEASAQMLSGDGDKERTALVPFLTEGPQIHLVASPTDRAEAEWVVREVERLVGGTSHRSVDSGPVKGHGETGGFTFGDIAVLSRLRSQQRLLEEAFAKSGMPYRVIGGERAWTRGPGRELLRRLRRAPPEASARETVRDLLRELRMAFEDPVGGSWLAVAATADTVRDLVESVVLRSPDDDFDPRAEAIALLTLHAAKGLEFDVVFLTGCEEGLLPYLRAGEDDAAAIAEERRLLYVGMTRARRLLCLTRAHKRWMYGRPHHQPPSRFLSDIEAALITARRLRGPAQRSEKGADRQLSLL